MKKRTIMMFSAVALLAILVVGGTMAWFTSTAEKENTFIAGTVEIKLHDVVARLEDGEEEPFTTLENINPGDEKAKVVYVESTGSKGSYIRVKLTPKWVVKDETTVLPNEITGENGGTVAYWPSIGAGWSLDNDGYYYYEHILKQGDKTTNLIEQINFNGPLMNNDYQGATFTLEVKAESVQASNYAFRDEWDKPGVKVPSPGVDEWGVNPQ